MPGPSKRAQRLAWRFGKGAARPNMGFGFHRGLFALTGVGKKTLQSCFIRNFEMCSSIITSV